MIRGADLGRIIYSKLGVQITAQDMKTKCTSETITSANGRRDLLFSQISPERGLQSRQSRGTFPRLDFLVR